MNKDDLPEVSFSGIPESALADVSVTVQEIVTTAFHECRVLWHRGLGKLQVVIRDEGGFQRFDGGFLEGWILVAHPFPRSWSGDQIVEELRRLHEFNTKTIKDKGFETILDFVEAEAKEIEAKDEAERDALADDIFGTAAAQRLWSIGGAAPGLVNYDPNKARERAADKASGARHLRRGRVLVARRPGLILPGGQ